ncbi:MAG: cation:proton antiporter [Gemmatimonadetes bacterium]|nr:cation:proton antiporter [Gemmatimonadota bacterium]
MAITILSIGLLVFAGHFLTGFFERTKVPDVLILMLAGILIGPVLGLVSTADFGVVGPVFTTLALVVILFEGGVHLNVKDLARSAGDTLFLSVATFVLTMLLVTHLADLFLPIDVYTALLIGVIVGGTSSAVVVPLIRILKLADRPGTILVLESALTDVLAVVLSLALMRGMQTGFSPTAIAGEVAAAFLLAALIGAVGAFVWSAVLPKIRQMPNTVFTTIAYVLILFGLTELWGYSGAIAALSFGVGVANLPNIPQRILGRIITFRLAGFSAVERTFFAEAVFLVKTFFFVFLGISIGFSNTRAVLVGLLLSVIAFLGRLVMVRLLVPRSVSRRHALLMTALIPKGLAAAVLAGMPSQLGLPNGELIQSTVYAVIFFTILFCAILVFAIESGLLDNVSAGFFGPFATEPSGPATAAYVVPSFEQSLGLPALREEYLEPNIVDLGDDRTPPEEENTPPPPSPV